MKTKLGPITKGTAKISTYTDHTGWSLYANEDGCVAERWYDESVHLTEALKERMRNNAALYADAHNTALKCNRLPSELLEERDAARKERDDSVGALRDQLRERMDNLRSVLPLLDTPGQGAGEVLETELVTKLKELQTLLSREREYCAKGECSDTDAKLEDCIALASQPPAPQPVTVDEIMEVVDEWRRSDSRSSMQQHEERQAMENFTTGEWVFLPDLPAGGGDVVGPASSTDNNVPQWDGTTGKLLKNGLWYFDQPVDPVSGQVIPRTTVEAWLKQAEEVEAELQKLRALVQTCVDALRTCDVFDPDYDAITSALSQAREHGFQPFNTNEG